MRHLFLAASLGAAMAVSSFAAHAGDADPNHYFINAGAGMSHAGVSGLNDKDSWGYGVNAGYRWRDTWGVEAGYVDLGKPETKGWIYGNSAYPQKLTLSVSGWTLGANGRWTFAENWHVSARLGAFFSRSKLTAQGYYVGGETANDTNLYFGAGLGYDITSQLSIGVNVDRYQAKAKSIFINGTNSTVLVSGTLEYRFISQ
ncbi:OmpA-OmpF porin, OOP family [Dyella sp. OK004]|uniref:outer membrane beta-barrel protein n=1 Tax=Dyella sp. OK004 TaxID=1855292 RepID=UPI0008E11C13|nr:outer membrane beta-barrel protein [Dyella sp. OK004]SFS08979.1 OmpA-OmpF porin, OOP family [Dyella sp. OK004]